MDIGKESRLELEIHEKHFAEQPQAQLPRQLAFVTLVGPIELKQMMKMIAYIESQRLS